jgi:creatinine amidohydrolase
LWIPDSGAVFAESVRAVAAREGIPVEVVGLHAGEWETSELLRLCPEQVRMERTAPGYTGDMDAGLARLVASGTLALAPTGVVGDPRPADAARGERYLAAQAACYEAALKQWLSQTDPA